jgi:DNA-binding XRE family transcriptional regulator
VTHHTNCDGSKTAATYTYRQAVVRQITHHSWCCRAIFVRTFGRVARSRDARYTDRLPQFADRVRELRRRAGLTQDRLAELAAVSVTTIQKIEQPTDAGNPRLTTLWALADALGVDPCELLHAPGTEHPPPDGD